MGLLTDPSAGQSKIIKLLIKYVGELCIFTYLLGIGGICLLAYRPFTAETYFSENALLPALVRSEYRDGIAPHTYYQELLDEMYKHESEVPYSWFLAKFTQIGLDAYTHNFTLNYPLGKTQAFTGKNVYGILRASRAASTESVVLSVPYRSFQSIHETTAPAISIMLGFAKFAKKQPYWAKDIIFLVTEHEQLGMQAWLEAYHGVSNGKEGVLVAGDMRGRAGAIQAAINLELHNIDIGEIDIKIEGLNGQLPNLDLFNLATRMCGKENVPTFKNRLPHKFADPYKDWMYMFQTLISMAATQATGIPNGNHGLFYKFGIQAVTLEDFHRTVRGKVGFISMGRILEGIFRSLNNLLERFHQSFFFYLLPANDRYVSIGMYIPAMVLLVATLFIKAYASWCKLNEKEEALKEKVRIPPKEKLGEQFEGELAEAVPGQKPLLEENWEEQFEEELRKPAPGQEFHLGHICIVFITTHLLGLVLKELPIYFAKIGAQYGYSTEGSVYTGLVVCTLLTSLVPVFIKKPSYASMIVLYVVSMLELGNLLICVAMYNISLAMFCGVLYVPFTLLMIPTRCRSCSFFQKLFWVPLHPFILATLTVSFYTCVVFWNESFEELLQRGLIATQQAVLFSIVDSMVYGNWLYSIVCMVMVPNWICFWYTCHYKPTVDEFVFMNRKAKED